MCGIVGLFGAQPLAEPQRQVLRQMRDRLTHRGPDGAGEWFVDRIGLGHRRLAIVDLERGQQPLLNTSGSLVVVFNGEIYNHPQLQRQWSSTGTIYQTHCDTETILHAYERYGSAAVSYLDGMFAFAVYDQHRQHLFLARDRFGKKPLFFAILPQAIREAANIQFAFASEIKALLQIPGLRQQVRLHETSLVDYLLHDYTLTAPQANQNHEMPLVPTMFTSIYALPAACTMTLDLSTIQPDTPLEEWLTVSVTQGQQRYWDIPWPWSKYPAQPISENNITNQQMQFGNSNRMSSKQLQSYSDTLLDLLRSAVDRRLMADVPIGVFLSGGVDSSGLVALLAERIPAQQIQTFSIGFDDPSFDETPYANLVAQHFQTDHQHRYFTAQDLFACLPPLAAHLDEPFADPSILPVSLLSQFASESVKVVLGGDGGDELFAGYDPFRAVSAGDWYYRHVPRWADLVGQRLLRWLPADEKNMGWRFRLERFQRGACQPAALRPAIWMGAFAPTQLQRLLPDVFAQRTPAEWFAREVAAFEKVWSHEPTPLRATLDFFSRFYLTDDILVKVDRASMFHSLEVRAPYLDTTLANWVYALPDQWKFHRGQTKWLLKQAFATGGSLGRPLLPTQIWQRPKKGFGIPVARWLRHELRPMAEQYLIHDWPRSLGMFHQPMIQQLWEEHRARRANHYKELWALLMLALWAQHWLES